MIDFGRTVGGQIRSVPEKYKEDRKKDESTKRETSLKGIVRKCDVATGGFELVFILKERE